MSSNADKRSDAAPPQEDVAGLFARFGGDARSYREFESKSVPPPRAVPPVAIAAVAPAPAPAPTPVPVLEMARPVQAPPVAPEAPEVGTAPRELDVLFSRLAGTPLPGTDTAHPLMARWRRPN